MSVTASSSRGDAIMARTFSPVSFSPQRLGSPKVPPPLLVGALRCWRRARDRGEAVQPCLTSQLRHPQSELLAPVFASLMDLCEVALARPLRVGASAALSADEDMVLGLVNGSLKRRACIHCNEAAASALDCALCSTRVMVAQTLADEG
jgi:hypothetical protein